MFEKNPVVVWASLIATLVTIAAGTAGGWYMILSLSEAVEEQSEALSEMAAELVELRKDAALQSDDLETIRQVQNRIIGTVDQRFDSLDASNRLLQLMFFLQER